MAHKCKTCRGDGIRVCPRCDGYGKMENNKQCYYCIGRGRIKCEICNGNGTVED